MILTVMRKSQISPTFHPSLRKFPYHFTRDRENSREKLSRRIFSSLFSLPLSPPRWFTLSVRHTRSLSVRLSFAQHKSRVMFTNFSSPFRVVAAKREKWKFMCSQIFEFHHFSGCRCGIEVSEKSVSEKFEKLFPAFAHQRSFYFIKIRNCAKGVLIGTTRSARERESEREIERKEEKATETRCASEIK